MLHRGCVCGGVSEPEQSEEDIKEGSPRRESEPEEGVHPWGHLGMGIQRWSRLREPTWEKAQLEVSSRTKKSSCKERPNAGC